MYIAAVPVDQQQTAFEAQKKWAVARAENAKAEADLNEANTQLGVARNDVSAAKLAVDSAMSQKKSADQSADTNRMNNAQRDLHTAESLKKAAEQRVRYLSKYVDYLKRYARYTAENMYWQEAQYEQSKAQIGKQNNIAPKGVSYDWFPKQIDERGKRTQSARDKAEREKVAVVQERENWVRMQGEADKEAGRTSNLWDPMAPKTGSATAGNASGNANVNTSAQGVGQTPAPAPSPAPAPNP